MYSRDVSMPEPTADNNHADDHGLGVVETERHVNWRNHAELRAKSKTGAKKLRTDYKIKE